MSRRQLEHERQRRAHNALLLLIISGALRPADAEVRYRGTDQLLGTGSGETDRAGAEAFVHHRSIWNTDIRELWTTDLRDVWDTVWTWSGHGSAPHSRA
jgi:hypothetical protein